MRPNPIQWVISTATHFIVNFRFVLFSRIVCVNVNNVNNVEKVGARRTMKTTLRLLLFARNKLMLFLCFQIFRETKRKGQKKARPSGQTKLTV